MFTLGGWRAQVPKDRSDIAPGLGCRFDARLGYLDRFVSVLARALDKSTGVDGQHIVPDFADHMRRPGKLHLAGPDPAADRGRAPRQKRWPASQVTATRERQAQARPGRSGGSARALDTGCSLSAGSAAVAAHPGVDDILDQASCSRLAGGRPRHSPDSAHSLIYIRNAGEPAGTPATCVEASVSPH